MRYTRKRGSRKLKPYSPEDFKKLSHREKYEYILVAGITQAVFSPKK